MSARRLFAATSHGFLLGCDGAQVTTFVQVRDPHLVRADVRQAMRGTPVAVGRDGAGAIVATTGRGATRTLMDDRGIITLGDPPGWHEPPPYALDATSAVLVANVYEGAGRSTRFLADVALSTPRGNVIEIKVRREPSRASPLPWLIVGVFFAAGSAATTYGIFAAGERPAERAGFGVVTAIFATCAAVTLGEAIYRVTGSREERVVYRGGP